MATQNTTQSAHTTESDVDILKGKKILQYPDGLASKTKDDYGNDVQYMMFKINTNTKSTPLRDDVASGEVLSSTRQGTGTATGPLSRSKNTDPTLTTIYGAEAVDKERWVAQKGMKQLDKVIILPMPNDHLMRTEISYNDMDQTMLTMAGDFANLESGAASDLFSYGKNAGIAALVNKGASYVTDREMTNRDALLAEDKLLMNPKQEVMFDGFQFRNFSFNYMFAPKSAKESIIVNQIIETFRYYSLPELTEGKMFYIFPSEFEISFMKGSRDNPNIHRITTSALKSVTVNYSPNGTWATLPNGAPVALTLTLEFRELELIDRKRVFNAKSAITSGF